MRNILESLGGAATVTQISQLMLGDIFSEPEWKRWWDSTKKLLNKEGYFLIPTKKSEPIQLRGEKVSRANELITFFDQARQPKEQAAALDQIIKFHNEFDKPETQLQPIVNTIEEAAARNQRLNPALVFRAGHGARRFARALSATQDHESRSDFESPDRRGGNAPDRRSCRSSRPAKNAASCTRCRPRWVPAGRSADFN